MKRRVVRVEIHNYRQYENLILDFSQSKNIIAFEGKGGAGKSNLLNAIAWCLYGDEPLKGKDAFDYLLSTHLRIDEEHKNDTVSVQLDAILGEVPVRFLRTIIENNAYGGPSTNFTAFYLKNDDWIEYSNPQYFVDNFLPISLRAFFMFDGENVKSLFDKGYQHHIKKNTEAISYIDLITKTYQHLDKILVDARRALGREAPDLSGLIEEQNLLSDKILKTEAFNIEDKAELQILKNEKEKYKGKQKTIDDFKHLTSRQEILERAQEASRKHLDHYSTEYFGQIGRYAPQVFLGEDLIEFSIALENLEQSGDLPPKINPEYVRDLIDGKIGKCVCGRVVNDDAKTHLVGIIGELEQAQSKSYLLRSNITLAKILHSLKNGSTELADLKKKIVDTEADLSKNQLELQDIKRKIGEAGGPIGDLQATINNLEQKIVEVERRIWTEDQELKQDRDAVYNLRRTIDLQGDVRRKHEAISSKIETIEFCIEKFNKLGEQNLQKSRLTLSNTMKKYFKELYWKKDYVDVYINEDFEIVIEKDVNGKKIHMPTTQLAGSEGATLGYSLMKGLSELSGFKDTPVFIDGPISDYSEDMQKTFLASLRNFVPNKQLFVFFKEDTHLVEPYIDSNLDAIQAFRIMRDEKAVVSEVEEW